MGLGFGRERIDMWEPRLIKTVLLSILLTAYLPRCAVSQIIEERIYGGRFQNLSKTATAFITRSRAAEPIGACTGSLIAKDLVLTAAHCVIDQAGHFDWYQVTVAGSRFSATAAHSHPLYDPFLPLSLDNNQHDIAVIELSGQVKKVSALPIYFDLPALKGKTAQVVGFGRNDQGVAATINDPYQAGKIGKIMIEGFDGNMIRTDFLGISNNSANPCQGDSGGPLLYQIGPSSGLFHLGLLGTVSFGPTRIIAGKCIVVGRYNYYVDLSSVGSQAFLSSFGNRIRYISGRKAIVHVEAQVGVRQIRATIRRADSLASLKKSARVAGRRIRYISSINQEPERQKLISRARSFLDKARTAKKVARVRGNLTRARRQLQALVELGV